MIFSCGLFRFRLTFNTNETRTLVPENKQAKPASNSHELALDYGY